MKFIQKIKILLIAVLFGLCAGRAAVAQLCVGDDNPWSVALFTNQETYTGDWNGSLGYFTLFGGRDTTNDLRLCDNETDTWACILFNGLGSIDASGTVTFNYGGAQIADIDSSGNLNATATITSVTGDIVSTAGDVTVAIDNYVKFGTASLRLHLDTNQFLEYSGDRIRLLGGTHGYVSGGDTNTDNLTVSANSAYAYPKIYYSGHHGISAYVDTNEDFQILETGTWVMKFNKDGSIYRSGATVLDAMEFRADTVATGSILVASGTTSLTTGCIYEGVINNDRKFCVDEDGDIYASGSVVVASLNADNATITYSINAGVDIIAGRDALITRNVVATGSITATGSVTAGGNTTNCVLSAAGAIDCDADITTDTDFNGVNADLSGYASATNLFISNVPMIDSAWNLFATSGTFTGDITGASLDVVNAATASYVAADDGSATSTFAGDVEITGTLVGGSPLKIDGGITGDGGNWSFAESGNATATDLELTDDLYLTDGTSVIYMDSATDEATFAYASPTVTISSTTGNVNLTIDGTFTGDGSGLTGLSADTLQEVSDAGNTFATTTGIGNGIEISGTVTGAGHGNIIFASATMTGHADNRLMELNATGTAGYALGINVGADATGVGALRITSGGTGYPVHIQSTDAALTVPTVQIISNAGTLAAGYGALDVTYTGNDTGLSVHTSGAGTQKASVHVTAVNALQNNSIVKVETNSTQANTAAFQGISTGASGYVFRAEKSAAGVLYSGNHTGTGNLVTLTDAGAAAYSVSNTGVMTATGSVISPGGTTVLTVDSGGLSATGTLTMAEMATPSTPVPDQAVIWLDTNGSLMIRFDSGATNTIAVYQ